MTKHDAPTDELDRGIARFMLCFPVHIDPILHRTRFRGRDFRQSELQVVTVLAARGPLPPTGIAHTLNMQKGSLTSVLKRLKRLGFIARRSNANDDRSYITALTPDGAALAGHLLRQRQRGLAALFSTMAPEDVRAAATGFGLIAAHLENQEEDDMTAANNSASHWYYAASEEDRREYDAYGPWVVEVKAEADMPPAFRSFYPTDKAARLLLKVPRKEERRELRPGMDLYRAVIALRDDGVTIREMVDGKANSREIGWDRIVAIRCRNDLLMGHWTLLLGNGTEVDLEFNRVSSDEMNRATDFVRARLAEPAPRSVDAAEGETRAVEIPQSEVFFGSVLHEITRRGPEPVVPIHFEPQDGSPPRGGGKSRVTTGVLVIEAPQELIIVNRDEAIRDQNDPSYASNDLFLPFNRMTAFAMDPPGPGDEPPLPMLSLHLGRQLFRQPCRAAPAGVVTALEAHGIPRVSDR